MLENFSQAVLLMTVKTQLLSDRTQEIALVSDRENETVNSSHSTVVEMVNVMGFACIGH